jgi:hypothetical protein
MVSRWRQEYEARGEEAFSARQLSESEAMAAKIAETPNIRNVDIQRKASERGMSLSPAYISETRKAFTR